MKSALLLLIFPLFMIGVVGVDDVVSVSPVKEGDLVTLHTAVTAIQTGDVIDWRFNGVLIARINSESSKISVWVKLDEAFKDRLQLDNQTGDLNIRNCRTTDSGQYILKITSTESSSNIFSISVVPADAVESVSVMKGDFVTLQIDHTDIPRNVIQWKFDNENSPVAEISKMTGIKTYDGPDGTFIGRLQLNQTGSLTIKNIGTKHSGLYEVEITGNRSRYTRQHTQSFSVTVRDAVKTVSVEEGDSVTLHTDTKIQNDDLILWMFGNTVIAEMLEGDPLPQTYDGPEGRFRDRLKLDHQTGSLTITNTRTTDSGDYKLRISSTRRTINRTITVTVTAVAGLVVATGTGFGGGLVVGGLLVAAVCSCLFKKHIISAIDDYCCCRKKSEQESNGDDEGNLQSML